MLRGFFLCALSNHSFKSCKTTPRKRQWRPSITTPRHKLKGEWSAKIEAPFTPLTCKELTIRLLTLFLSTKSYINTITSVRISNNKLTVTQWVTASFALLIGLGVRSVELGLCGQNRCKGFPSTVSPESSQCRHQWVPLNCSMFVTSARAGKSHEQTTRAARTVAYPVGVRTCIPIYKKNDVWNITGSKCQNNLLIIPWWYKSFAESSSGRRKVFILGFSLEHHRPARIMFFLENLSGRYIYIIAWVGGQYRRIFGSRLAVLIQKPRTEYSPVLPDLGVQYIIWLVSHKYPMLCYMKLVNGNIIIAQGSMYVCEWVWHISNA